jgi:hypothetical protein
MAAVNSQASVTSLAAQNEESIMLELGQHNCFRDSIYSAASAMRVIVLRKVSQLSATSRIREAIGQRSTFLSATVPTLRVSQPALRLCCFYTRLASCCHVRGRSTSPAVRGEGFR